VTESVHESGSFDAFEEADDLDAFLADKSDDLEFRGALDDAEARARVLRVCLARRRSLKLSQKSVAEAMGTTQSAVSDLENGATDPRLSTLQRYVRAVGGRLHTEVITEEAGDNDLFWLINHRFSGFRNPRAVIRSDWHGAHVVDLAHAQMDVIAESPQVIHGELLTATGLMPFGLPVNCYQRKDVTLAR
jgi:transcriptional regulator with XRE-family HTH domain